MLDLFLFPLAIRMAAATACFTGWPDLTISRMLDLTVALLEPFLSGMTDSYKCGPQESHLASVWRVALPGSHRHEVLPSRKKRASLAWATVGGRTTI